MILPLPLDDALSGRYGSIYRYRTACYRWFSQHRYRQKLEVTSWLKITSMMRNISSQYFMSHWFPVCSPCRTRYGNYSQVTIFTHSALRCSLFLPAEMLKSYKHSSEFRFSFFLAWGHQIVIINSALLTASLMEAQCWGLYVLSAH